MKPGTPPPSPDDDAASDPLLAALRQRLGDYGQAPPPAAWAAIRQRLPPAPMRPWWRRPRRMLPLLVLLLSVVVIGLLAGRRGQLVGSARQRGPQLPLARRLAGQPKAATQPAAAGATAASEAPVAAAAQPPAESLSAAPTAAAPPLTTAVPRRAATRPGSFSKQPALAKRGFSGQGAGAEKRGHLTQESAFSAHHSLGTRPAPASAASLAFTAKNRRRFSQYAASSAAPATGRKRGPARYAGSHFAKSAAALASAAPALSASAGPTRLVKATPTIPAHLAYAALKKRQARQEYLRARPLATARTNSRGPRAAAGAPEPIAPNTHLTGRPHSALGRGVAGPAGEAPGTAAAGAAVDSLALAQPVLVLAAGGLPAALRATPDSVRPAGPPVRRWSVLLVAGPTLSYRTLGLAPALAVGQPDFARLERPALGLGAQVQVRRVLSGRWALAVGLGYHEYATRLALSRKDSGIYTSVQQRDTYRLLTVPVQLSYALGVPRARLSWALLSGLEPGWYLGGRSTEGSSCSCQQQAYSSAAASPYRSLSLAFSLGLDVRYRLGNADSRWQWLVQPTGRYVTTPFVRSDAVGFTRRQPFSLGLLTGFSWDVR